MDRASNLEGRNIYLRPLNQADAQTFVRWMDDPDVARYLPQSILAKDTSFWSRFCATDEHHFKYAIVERDARKVIGMIGLFALNHQKRCAQTGTIIGAKRFWRRGRAWEAKMLCLDFGFRVLKLKFVFSRIDPENHAVRNHLKRCGYGVFPNTGRQGAGGETAANVKMTYVLFEQNWRAIWQKYLNFIGQDCVKQ